MKKKVSVVEILLITPLFWGLDLALSNEEMGWIRLLMMTMIRMNFFFFLKKKKNYRYKMEQG